MRKLSSERLSNSLQVTHIRAASEPMLTLPHAAALGPKPGSAGFAHLAWEVSMGGVRGPALLPVLWSLLELGGWLSG